MAADGLSVFPMIFGDYWRMLAKLQAPAADRRPTAEPYRMIHCLEISNFRCYERLRLDNLGSVNVVVGANGCGKTTILEAIYLTLGSSPELAFRLRGWRGMGNVLAATSQSGYDSLWSDLFHNFDEHKVINIALRGTSQDSNSLEVSYDAKIKNIIRLNSQVKRGSDDEPMTDVVLPVTFKYREHGQKVYTIRPKLTRQGKLETGNVVRKTQASFYSSAFIASVGPLEPAHQFSEFSKKKKAQPIIDEFKKLFPDLDNLSVEIQSGIEMLFCDVPWVPSKLPVALISGGAQKMVSILLGIATQTKGVILIDELENGVYYKLLPKVWESLYSFAKRFGVQLFVSTHSKECLQAVLPIMAANEDSFRLLRAERQGGRYRVRQFPGKEFASAIEEDVEIR
jgi:AAA15 family ATPase/GTPase